MNISKVTFYVLIFIANFAAFGQPGNLDLSFNPNDVGSGQGYGFDKRVWKAVEQPDGKIILGGYFSTYSGQTANQLVRVNPDGSIDNTFNIGSGIIPGGSSNIHDLMLLNDGKILVSGTFKTFNGFQANRMVRLNPNGSVDTTFQSDTTINCRSVFKMKMDYEGKILALTIISDYDGGYLPNSITRFHPDGSVDTTFTGQPQSLTWIYDLDLLSDSSIVICGSRSSNYASGVNRLNPDGSLLSSYSGLIQSIGTLMSVKVVSNDQFIIAGNFKNGDKDHSYAKKSWDFGSYNYSFYRHSVDIGGDYQFDVESADSGYVFIGGTYRDTDWDYYSVLHKHNEVSGAIDSSFSPPKITGGHVVNITYLKDGRVLIVGDFDEVNGKAVGGMAILDHQGVLDKQFGTVQGVQGEIKNINQAPNGKIFLGGDFTSVNNFPSDNVIALESSGIPDTSFNVKEGTNNTVYDVQGLASGKVLIAGFFDEFDGEDTRHLIRLNADGTIDPLFNKTHPTFDYPVRIMEQQADGKILVGGDFRKIGGSSRQFIGRLNENGFLDYTFNPGSGLDRMPLVIKEQTDAKILMGGNFTKYNGVSKNYIARVNPDGSEDSTFVTGSGFDWYVNDLVLQSDGKILVVGEFSTYNGTNCGRIIRLNSDGTVDNTFNTGTGANGAIHSIVYHPNGKIVVFGAFTSFNGSSHQRICGLDANGNIDNNFDAGSGANGSITRSHLLNDGRIIFSGDFNSYNGVNRNKIAIINHDSISTTCNLSLNFNRTQPLGCSNTGVSVEASVINGTPPFSYNWNSSGFQASNSLDLNTKGTYQCLVSDQNNCRDSASVWISEVKHPSGSDLFSNFVFTEFRTGFDVHATIPYGNNGCQKDKGQIKLILDSLVDFLSATPAPTLIQNNLIFWDFDSINYLDISNKIKLVLKTKVTASIGDTVHIITNINGTQLDIDSANNQISLFSPVINGYDPNDIRVHPQGACDEGFVDSSQTLTYTIRFQNTGNAEAININVVDSLGSNLDLSTLHVLSASDSMYTQVYPGNVINFVFDSIMLPDSTNHEPESHGYIVYEILPKSNLANGTQIKNRADIYFDFNPPVLTNTTLNTIQSGDLTSLCTPTFLEQSSSSSFDFNIYPNPSDGVFAVKGKSQPSKITVVDHLGRVIKTLFPSSNVSTINLRGVHPGLYFIQVESFGKAQVLKAVVN